MLEEIKSECEGKDGVFFNYSVVFKESISINDGDKLLITYKTGDPEIKVFVERK